MLPGLESLPLDGPVSGAPDGRIERALAAAGYGRVAGVDEVGRGCLAGPVVAAAAILPEGLEIPGLTDSKQMAEEDRLRAADLIRTHGIFGIGMCSPKEIDRWNILRASLEAMKRALVALGPQPDFLLVDGNQPLPGVSYPQQTVVKGDARSLVIAAASVLAKVERDAIMLKLDQEHPGYGWAENVGYPTADHFEGLRNLGPSPHHRRTFRLRIEDTSQMKLF